MKGQRILVVGATGLIGFALAKELSKDNDVYGVARFRKNSKGTLEKYKIKPLEMDITKNNLDQLPTDLDYVFNETLLYDPDLQKSMEVNAFAVGKLLEHSQGCKGVIVGSTGSVHGRSKERKHEDSPLIADSAYPLSKICGEMFAVYFSQQYQIPVAILRYYQPYSTSSGVVRGCIDMIMANKPIEASDRLMNPLFISDVVDLTVRAAGVCNSPPNIINIGGEEVVSPRKLTDMVGGVVGRNPLFVSSSTDLAASESCDSTKRRRVLGSQKVSLSEGIKKVWSAYQAEE